MQDDDIESDDLHSEIEHAFGDFSGADFSAAHAGGESVQQGVFICGYCGSENHTFIDPAQGEQQEYVEDCQTCCRPNLLRVYQDAGSGEWQMHAELE